MDQADAEIVGLAEEVGADLSFGGIRLVLIGSVSDSMARHARCPVLFVRGW